MGNLTIGVLAASANVNIETVRFYQRKGLLTEPSKPYGSIRRYGENDLVRLRFIKSAQNLGFSLDDVAQLLKLDDGMHCQEASTLAAKKLYDVRNKLKNLKRIETSLVKLIQQCDLATPKVCCPLIKSLNEIGMSKS